VQILVLRRAQGFKPKIVDDEQRYASESGELALVGAGGAGGVEGCDERMVLTVRYDGAACVRASIPSLGKACRHLVNCSTLHEPRWYAARACVLIWLS